MCKRAFFFLTLTLACCAAAAAQKGTAEPDYYPLNYSGDTWTGEVTAVDNDKRELTLTYAKGKKPETFIAVIPDGGFGWGKDGGGDRVLMFFGENDKANAAAGMEKADLNEFMGRRIKVYYKRKDKKVGDEKVKLNEVFRIKVLKSEK
jgi:hypothetical protein